MTEKSLRASDKIALLQEQFRLLIPSRIEELKTLWSDLLASDSHEKLVEMQRKAHSLAGSAGTFGAPLVSSQARGLDTALRAVLAENRSFSRIEQEYILGCLQKLHEIGLVEASSQAATDERVVAEQLSNRLIYVVDDDPVVVMGLVSVLETKGFAVTTMETAEEFRDAYAQRKPAVVIIDLQLATGAGALLDLLHHDALRPPVVCLSAQLDMVARLLAVRTGVKRFLAKPVDETQLLRAVYSVLNHVIDQPYRVLIVDDDVELAAYYRALLTEAGIQVRTVADPYQVLALMKEFKPELLLLDVFMPGSTGLELAAVLRQDDENAGLPIIFLSSEEKIDKQMAALNLGGDDFISKPVLPAHLLQAVTARLKRSRRINELNLELARAFKQTSTLREAMERHDLVSVTDVDGTITYANDNFCRVSGYQREELVGKSHRIVNSGHHSREFFREMWDTISHGRVWRGTLCNRTKSGEYYWVESTIVPFFDANGLPYQYVSIRTDITPLKKVEAELRESRQRLSLSQTFAHMGTWDLDTGSYQLHLADTAAPLFGLRREAQRLPFRDFLQHVHPQDVTRLLAAIDASKLGGGEYRVEYRYYWPDSSEHWLEGRGDVSADPVGGVHLLGMVQDISERKVMERDIEQQRQLLALLRNGMSMFMAAEEFAGVVQYLLRGLMEITGSSLGLMGEVSDAGAGAAELHIHALLQVQAAGESPRSLPLPVGDEIRQRLQPVYRPVLQYRQVLIGNALAVGVLRDDGGQDEEIGNFLTVPVFYAERFVGLFSLMNREGGFGDEVIELLQPFTASYGVLIQAQRAQEREQLIRQELVVARDAAERANRLKSQFLHGVSHELRTPLNAILGFGQLLLGDTAAGLSADQQENIAEILSAGQHLLHLIDDILDLARIEAGKIGLRMSIVELQPVIKTVLVLMGPLAAARQVALQCASEEFAGHYVWADAVRLKQILINLLSNAIKYNKPGGVVELHCRPMSEQILQLDVIDSGIGISSENIKQLFAPFSRLDAEVKGIPGTGLGLVLSRDLVQKMDGSLGVESQEGVGTTFYLRLRRQALDSEQ